MTAVALGAPTRVGVRVAVTPRRAAQLALGVLWLVDGVLQFQAAFFRRSFVTGVLEPATSGAPWVVAHPALWADHLILHDVGAFNALFATLQLVIGACLLWRPAVRVGLGLSVAWGVAVWWFAEGIGGVTNGANPVTGAPGAAVLYALVAVLAWPGRGDGGSAGGSIAESGRAGRWPARAAWVLLWGSFVALGLERATRAPSALHDTVLGAASGEPGWVQALDRGLATPLDHHGTEVSLVLAALYVVIAAGVLVGRLRRPAVVLAVAVAVAFWLAQDFGGVLTGSGTDVNSGPLLALLAACYWPLSGRRRARA